jgi:tRNA A-37 threonylcarbamoyl transferase component Bud32
MLSHADAALAARDSKLPGLTTLLDPAAMTDALRAIPDLDIEQVRLDYLRYKPGTNCLAAYQAETKSAGVLPIYAKAHASDAEVKITKATARARGRTHGALILPEGIVAYAFPDDAKLRVLERLADPSQRRRLLARIFAARDGMEAGRLETLAYKPERRYTARFEAEPGACVLKFYVDDGYEVARHACKVLESREVLRLAERRGGSKRHATLALEWLPGDTLREALKGSDVDGVIRRVGRALAELHVQQAPTLTERTESQAFTELRALASTLSFLCPALRKRPGQLANALIQRLAAEEQRRDVIHGDLYDKQIVLDRERVGLLDLDQVGRGDPRRDLALLVAHLERDVLLGGLAAGQVTEIEGTLLDSYQQARGESVPTLSLFVAEALLRLAHHPFRTHTEDWQAHTTALLERAEQRLQEA